MNLKDYLAETGNAKRAREALAPQVGTSPDYLRMVAAGHRKASPAMARKISDATHGVVSLQELRPDVWSVGE